VRAWTYASLSETRIDLKYTLESKSLGEAIGAGTINFPVVMHVCSHMVLNIGVKGKAKDTGVRKIFWEHKMPE
jgi:hypothetical protein